MPQSPVSLRMFRVVAYRLPVLHLVNRASGVLICFICLNMWVNIMVLALNPGPQFVAITGNPAGLLFWRIWYSVGKSGVLGITEYRQGRPLVRFLEYYSIMIHSKFHSILPKNG